MVIAKLWVIVKPRNEGIFKETFSTSENGAWDEFYLGGVCEDAIVSERDCDKLGYKAQEVDIVLHGARGRVV